MHDMKKTHKHTLVLTVFNGYYGQLLIIERGFIQIFYLNGGYPPGAE